jgi:L-cysteine:1D-myo-inositol 2-amino-2-deoxy-alpha-D-glucopyranoside ligase
VKLYDTAKRAYLDLKPEHVVKIYVCGITPYDSAHLGHVFTFMTYDLLQRRLEDLGHEVHMVRNVTDVDEPIYVRAKELGVPYTQLAQQELVSFHETMGQLNFRPLFAEPLASEYIADMAKAVKTLLDRGVAYHVDADIYFDTSTYPKLGELSGFSDRLILGLAAMRGGDPDRPGKRQPLDFLLWKAVDDPNDSAQWQSPVGIGRPGWHIECSVMSSELLGSPFDIHGGGSDLIFPHHSAEIAQSHGLGHSLLAHHWVHVYPLFSDGEKMSKSLGNLVFASDLLAIHESAVIRLALMHYHHRIGGEWQPELLHEAEKLLNAVRTAAKRADIATAKELHADVRAALDDDINTLEVVDALHRFVKASDASLADRAAVHEIVTKALALAGLA